MSAFQPGPKDWLLLVVSAAFTAAGVFLFTQGYGRPALAVTLFFGACTGIAAWVLRSKGRAARQARDPELSVAALGGVRLAAPRRRKYLVALGLVAFGLALAYTGAEISETFVLVSLAIAGAGVGVLVALAFGWQAQTFLEFTPEGVRVGAGGHAYTLHWDNIEGVGLGEIHSNPAVMLRLYDVERLLASVEPLSPRVTTAKARARLERGVRWSEGLFGCPIGLMPIAFAVEPVVLLRAIARYLEEPALRVELQPRAELAAPDDAS
ncbi:MAG: hypothetical protein KC636_11335 [Myxococcales bacterium]|nr:hypothetical protein [Myxococcales bacterium]